LGKLFWCKYRIEIVDILLKGVDEKKVEIVIGTIKHFGLYLFAHLDKNIVFEIVEFSAVGPARQVGVEIIVVGQHIL
jgi:hypothetical protein